MTFRINCKILTRERQTQKQRIHRKSIDIGMPNIT